MAGGGTSWKGSFGVLAVMVVAGAASPALASLSSFPEPLPAPSLNPGDGAPAEPKAKWAVFRSTSEIDRSRNVQLQLYAEAPIKGWLSEATPTLVIRCEEHKREVFIVTDMVANPEPGHAGEATVTLRFDKDPAVQHLAAESTDQKALFLRNATEMARTMAEHRRMLFRFVPFFSVPQVTVFDLTVLKESLPEVEATCALE